MKEIVVTLAVLLAAANAIPVSQISPGMRVMMMDMMKNMLATLLPQQTGVSPTQASQRAYAPAARIAQQTPAMQSPPGRAFVNNAAPSSRNGGMFMNMPRGGPRGFGMMRREYCPPGPARLGSDSCKDQVLREALYFKNGDPRYDWVHPLNPYDPSVSDHVKDIARDILYGKLGNRVPTAKEAEMMSILGDPPNHLG